MSSFKVEGPEIKKLLKVARNKQISFAYNPGKGDPQYLGLDKRKPPKVLGQEAKKLGDGAKAAFGTATLDGKLLSLKCDVVLPAMAKKLKKYLRTQKVPLNVEICDATGKVLESDISDDIPDDPEVGAEKTKPTEPAEPSAPSSPSTPSGPSAPSEPTKASEPAPATKDGKKEQEEAEKPNPKAEAAKELTQKLVAMKPELAALPSDVGAPLLEVFAKVVAAMKSGKVSAAAAAAEKVQVALEKAQAKAKAAIPDAPPLPEDPPAKPPAQEDQDALRDQLTQAFAALQDQYKDFQGRGDKSLTAKAKQLHDAFGATIDTDLKKTERIVSTLKKFLEAQLANLPARSAADLAKDAILAAEGKPAPADRYEQSAAIQTKYPGASVAAKDAMDGFAAVLGDQEVTPELLTAAKDGIAKAEERLAKAEARLAKANKLADGPNKAEAIRLAQLDVDGLKDRVKDAKEFEKAARGKKGLSEALAFGPLSPNSAQSFSDDAAKALIEGFSKDPDLTTAAIAAAETAKHPDAVAKGLGKIIDQRETGFADSTGKAFAKPEVAEKYAKDLLTMGATVGPEFFERMDDYMASGRQHVTDPMGDMRIADKTAKAQKRSAVVGKALLKDGQIDLTTQEAKDAVGDLLFNPHSLREPMPAMNEHVVKTLEFMGDADNAEAANGILSDIPETTTKTSRKLVRKALRKRGRDAVGKGDAQTAVMASMLKPLDQGPVGSCFATAPARRMRETEPLKAMEAYASIAGTGKYKPAFGPEVAAVTNLPRNEDPLMRSWEYSLATSTARVAGSSRSKSFESAMDKGTDALSDKLTDILSDKASEKGGLSGLFGSLKERVLGLFKADKLRTAIADSFEFTYDPTSKITDSSDGSSTTGRYILVNNTNNNEIRSKAAFATEIANVAIAFAELDPTSDEADEVRTFVSTDAFIDSVTPEYSDGSRYLPWEQSSGGQTTAATKTLFGDKMEQKKFVDKETSIVDMGDRTEELLGNMLSTFTGAPEEMITIRTVGMHGFNALPNDPSLAKLKGDTKDEIEANVKTHLIDVGKALKDTDIEEKRAAYLFDKQIELERKKIDGDATLLPLLEQGATAHRPSDACTPAEINAAVENAIDAYLTEKAKGYTDQAKAKAWFKKQAAGESKTAMMRDLGAPEFVIADSNWGSAEDHTFFVIAPDPTTGEPQLWQKTVPPGSMRPATDDWAKAEWASIR
ncbi:hypothetical protein DL239_18935 [Sedimentitalea sp. CY04]|uniref:Uncharacterized protein n=1 Tax=Parasedimentitalea denitrificans TaxID=2211118 RepID=A0ABX0WFD6_9RHOB|nr:hypothetical protein [Sedimentitalea sp. CY04]NIZ63045.1 hypothetical protein [Sedimentitalea sp. CY04]